GGRPLRVSRPDPCHTPSFLSPAGGRVHGRGRAGGRRGAVTGGGDGGATDQPSARRGARRADAVATGAWANACVRPWRYLVGGGGRIDQAPRSVGGGELVSARAVCGSGRRRPSDRDRSPRHAAVDAHAP